MTEDRQQVLSRVARQLSQTAKKEAETLRKNTVIIPSREAVASIVERTLHLLFPSYFGREMCENDNETCLFDLFRDIKRQISAAFALDGSTPSADTESLAVQILSRLPDIQEMLCRDVEAIYEGDPAARGREEILLSYPGFFAIAVFRIAHEYYLHKIPYLSRMMTEYAHGKTGIDIHPGATIGAYFFIDHGTGIVIGETTVIGEHVKLYQGVTLGAKSFELDENGHPVKGIKRHPNIGNGVIIYANATILGGRTTVGDGSVIGGNVWLTHSVPANTTVSYREQSGQSSKNEASAQKNEGNDGDTV
ncbi:MAG: serine acetyltransferase [Clostridia bacterium]|nr:serine acetyltransferase [Clostridia bacterium]